MWPVRLVRNHSHKKTRQPNDKSGSLSAGWPALRDAFGGTLHHSTTLEMTRAGDRFGGPGPPVMDMRVVDGDDAQIYG